MPEIGKVIELKHILEEGFSDRQIVIKAICDAFGGSFSRKSIEHLKEIAPAILSVMSGIRTVITKIKGIREEDFMFTEALDILQQEHKNLFDVREEYFIRTFAQEVTLDWAAGNLQIDKLKIIAAALSSLRAREEILLNKTIMNFISQVSKQKRAVLAGRFK